MKKPLRTVQSPPPPLGGDITAETLRVGLYIRVSTDRQVNEGDSLEEQEKELRKYCDYRNFQIHKLYIERGKSGGNTNRPEYQALIKDIEAQRLNTVVVKKLDRLSRSLLDFESLMVTLQNHNVDFISLREQFDTTNAMGKAMLRMALVFAQLEREQTSERITDVMTHRASMGHYNGGPVPYGYHVLNKELLPNKREQAVVELIFSKFMEIRSMASVARFLNDARIHNRKDQPWVDTQIQSMLENPVYIGQVRWKYETYPGMHVPLVGKTLFEEVQVIFANTQFKQKTSRTTALFQKILFCGECQCVMTTSFSYNRTKTRYRYYRCVSTTKAEVATSSCSLKYRAQSTLEAQFFKSLHELCHPTKLKPIEAKIITHNLKIEAKTQIIQTKANGCDSQLADIKVQRSKYLDALIINDFLSEERQLIRSQIQTLETESRQLQSQLSHFRLEISHLEDGKVQFDQFKAQIIQLLDLHQQQDIVQLQHYLPKRIDTITLFPDQWTIQFQSLPWPIDLPIFPNPRNSQ